MGRAVGIDLGTTNSCLAVVEEGKVRVIPNAEGESITPSVVAIGENGTILIGSAARRQAIMNPQRTVYSSKRFIGRSFSEIEAIRSKFPFLIEPRSNGQCQFNLSGRVFNPEDIAALILQKLVRDASKQLGEEITQAVITVPAYFTDEQRHATKLAGEIAGLEVLRIINEPTAAALSQGLGRGGRETVVVYDIGGGTTDVTVLEVDNELFEVQSTSGDTFLGGDDFDSIIVDWLSEKCRRLGAVDLAQDKVAMQRIREAAEAAKIQLSTIQEAHISLPFLLPEGASERSLCATLSRAEFEELSVRLLERCRTPVREAIQGAGIAASEISRVLLVGGSGRMPIIRALLSLEFPKREIIAPSNTEEVIARGAAVQAGILTGEVTDQLLMDVTPFALGIEVAGGEFLPVISQNSPIPIRCSEFFTTAAHFQRGADIKVLQQSGRGDEPKTIGCFALEGFRGGARGSVDIEIIFEIDESGMLTVSARDVETGRSNQISIRPDSNLERVAEKATSEVREYNAQATVAELIKNAEYLVERLIRVGEEAQGNVRLLKKCEEIRERLREAADGRSERKIRGATQEAEKFLSTL